jgi:predicted enzyme involved in methoxymalonyl-ACP biosynthesis
MDGQTIHIRLWLMSCRVLKRDMEFAMMDSLVSLCAERGVREIIGYYYPTPKNGMVKDFYAVMGFAKISVGESGDTVWRFGITDDYECKNRVIEVRG